MSYQRNGGQATLPARTDAAMPARRAATPAIVSASIGDLADMAEAVHRSQLWPQLKNPQQVLSLMLLCQADGLHPMQAIRRYHIIEGQPSMKADAMLAEYQRRGGRVRWIERTPEVCHAHFSHPEHNPEGQEIRVTLKELADSGVAMGWDKKGNRCLKANYQRHPRQMLTARVISEGVRLIDPGVVAGIYTPEEVSDFKFEPGDHAAEPYPAEAALPRAGDTSMAPDHVQLPKLPMPKEGSPETDRLYREWRDRLLEEMNLAWADYWSGKLQGDIPSEVPHEFISVYQLEGHLLKHFGAGRKTHGYSKAGEVRFLSGIFYRDPASITFEAKDYARDVYRKKRDEVLAKLGVQVEEEEADEAPEDDDIRATEGGNDD